MKLRSRLKNYHQWQYKIILYSATIERQSWNLSQITLTYGIKIMKYAPKRSKSRSSGTPLSPGLGKICSLSLQPWIVQSRIPADIGGAGIERVHFLLATINTKLLKKSWAKSNDPINFYRHKCNFPMFDRPVFGWLLWATRGSKKYILSGNVLAISCSFTTNTKKIKNVFTDLPCKF
jgi:hypothetical protein